MHILILTSSAVFKLHHFTGIASPHNTRLTQCIYDIISIAELLNAPIKLYSMYIFSTCFH